MRWTSQSKKGKRLPSNRQTRRKQKNGMNLENIGTALKEIGKEIETNPKTAWQFGQISGIAGMMLLIWIVIGIKSCDQTPSSLKRPPITVQEDCP
jgi:hypothetical protein